MLLLKSGKYSGSISKSLRSNDLIACVTVYDEQPANEKRHCHENSHISFVLSGGNLEKRKYSEIKRLPGKTTFYHSGELHQSTHIIQGSTHINLEIQQQLLKKYDFNESTLAFAAAHNPAIGFLMLQVYKEIQEADVHSEVSIRMLLLDSLNQSSHLINKKEKHYWIKDLDELLRARWNQKVSLEELSVILRMHPVTLSRQFHNYFSCTLGVYMRKLKIEKAISLIKCTPQSLTDIAYECGFADQSHFIRSFKQFTGLLPKELKNM